MKGFIEVTNLYSNEKVLCPIDKITGIVCDADGDVFIEMGTYGYSALNEVESSGIYVVESFDEIKEKMGVNELRK